MIPYWKNQCREGADGVEVAASPAPGGPEVGPFASVSSSPSDVPTTQEEASPACCPTCGRKRRKSSFAARNQAMVQAYEQGETLQEIGDRYGLTRERVRQIIEGIRTTVAIRAEHPRPVKVTLGPELKAFTCFVCWKTFWTADGRRTKGRVQTCSKRCHYLYSRTRHFIDRQAWLLAVARSYANLPEGTAQHRWATKVLAGGKTKRKALEHPNPYTEAGKAYAEVLRLRSYVDLTEEAK